jgi:hypothetical protein
LVASKAGQLWKSLDQKTKDDYNDKAKMNNSPEPEPKKEPEPEPEPKKEPEPEPEPKKEPEPEPESKKEPEPEPEADEETLNVESFTHEGVEYYLDVDNNVIYDIKSEEEVGKIVDGKVIMN